MCSLKTWTVSSGSQYVQTAKGKGVLCMEELHIPVFTLTPTTNRMLELKALNPILPYLSVHLWCKWPQEQTLTTGFSLSKQFGLCYHKPPHSSKNVARLWAQFSRTKRIRSHVHLKQCIFGHFCAGGFLRIKMIKLTSQEWRAMVNLICFNYKAPSLTVFSEE